MNAAAGGAGGGGVVAGASSMGGCGASSSSAAAAAAGAALLRPRPYEATAALEESKTNFTLLDMLLPLAPAQVGGAGLAARGPGKG